MLPGPILAGPDLRPTFRVARPAASRALHDAADAHRERADVATRDAALLLSRAGDETGLAAEALRLAAARRRRIAAEELAAAEELTTLANRLEREGR